MKYALSFVVATVGTVSCIFHANPASGQVAAEIPTTADTSEEVDRLQLPDTLANDEAERGPSSEVKKAEHEGKHQIHLLGMTVVRDRDWPLVLDVIALSPAWDAGIRDGDRIRSLEGVEGKPFQNWMEAARKIIQETIQERNAKEKIAVVLERGDKQFDVRIGMWPEVGEEARSDQSRPFGTRDTSDGTKVTSDDRSSADQRPARNIEEDQSRAEDSRQHSAPTQQTNIGGISGTPYYFGGAGGYAQPDVLTGEEIGQFRELQALEGQQGLTVSQRQELEQMRFRLRGDTFQPLTDDQRQALLELRRGLDPSSISGQERRERELSQLEGQLESRVQQELNGVGGGQDRELVQWFSTELRHLLQLHENRQLNPPQRRRLNQLQQFRNRFPNVLNAQTSGLSDRQRRALLGLQQEARRSNQLQSQSDFQLQRRQYELQRARDRELMRQFSQEYQQLHQLQQSQQLTRAQQARLMQLQRFNEQFQNALQMQRR